MRVSQLTLKNAPDWATLLAVAFDRTTAEMLSVLDWLHASFDVIAWGAWQDNQLAAQYTCLMRSVYVPALQTEIRAGMSVNMAVHPAYRGRGLVKHIAHPVYEHVSAMGGVAGLGFSNAEGVKVDRNSTQYGYRVCGQLIPVLAWIPVWQHSSHLDITKNLDGNIDAGVFASSGGIHFVQTKSMLQNRYYLHPFRHYQFAVWREGGCICGIVVYRLVTLMGVPTAALLGAYGVDVRELLRRWMVTMRSQGIALIHLLSSPQASIRKALAQIAPVVPLPYARTPYYLTVKPLSKETPFVLFDFAAWDCVGGDVL